MRRFMTASLLTFAVIALSSCSAAPPQNLAPQSQTESPSPVPTLSVRGLVHPTEAQQQAYLAAVRKIAPGLTVKEDRAVSHGRSICLDVANKDAAITLKNEMARDDLDQATAQRVIDAAKANLCPSFS